MKYLPTLRMAQVMAVIAMAMCPIWAAAQSSTEAYAAMSHITQQGDTLLYRLLSPENVREGEVYPLVVFMHGAGERGSDNEAQLTHGSQMWLNPVVREKYPAYVLMPQCPKDDYWAYDSRPETFTPALMPIQEDASTPIVAVMEVVDELLAGEPIDANRVYVMGLSMGGMATYDMAVRYPEVFAAAVPICGTVNPERLTNAKDVPFRIYHGDADPTVTVEGSRSAYRMLRQLGAEVIYKEYPGVTHGSWNQAFNDSELLPWLFAQKKLRH